MLQLQKTKAELSSIVIRLPQKISAYLEGVSFRGGKGSEKSTWHKKWEGSSRAVPCSWKTALDSWTSADTPQYIKLTLFKFLQKWNGIC